LTDFTKTVFFLTKIGSETYIILFRRDAGLRSEITASCRSIHAAHDTDEQQQSNTRCITHGWNKVELLKVFLRSR